MAKYYLNEGKAKLEITMFEDGELISVKNNRYFDIDNWYAEGEAAEKIIAAKDVVRKLWGGFSTTEADNAVAVQLIKQVEYTKRINSKTRHVESSMLGEWTLSEFLEFIDAE